MTVKEAIRRIKDHFRVHDDGRPTPYLDKAVEMAIEALEKQIPKKPYYEADGYAYGELVYDSAECPTCGHLFEYDINDWESNYCLNCGQKLDWGEEND